MTSANYPPLAEDPSPASVVLILLILVGSVASQVLVCQRVPLIGGVLAGSFSAAFALGMADGWKGVHFLELSVTTPSPWHVLIYAPAWALIAGITATIVVSRMISAAATRSHMHTAVIIGASMIVIIVVLVALSMFVVSISFFAVQHTAGIGVLVFTLLVLSPLFRGIAHRLDRVWQQSPPQGKRVVTGAVVLLCCAGIAASYPLTQIPDVGSFDGRCTQSFRTVSQEAQRQQWQGFTQEMLGCDGSVGDADILVHLDTGQTMLCRTGSRGQDVMCTPFVP